MREFLKDVWMHGGEESRAITDDLMERIYRLGEGL